MGLKRLCLPQATTSGRARCPLHTHANNFRQSSTILARKSAKFAPPKPAFVKTIHPEKRYVKKRSEWTKEMNTKAFAPRVPQLHRRTAYAKIQARLQFPPGYPATPLIVEVDNAALPQPFLRRLTKKAEEEARKSWATPTATVSPGSGGHSKKGQAVVALRVVMDTVENNKLLSCWKEMRQAAALVTTRWAIQTSTVAYIDVCKNCAASRNGLVPVALMCSIHVGDVICLRAAWIADHR